MKLFSKQWFEVKISFMKTMEDGKVKKVSEVYVVDACSFAEAEAKIIDEQQAFHDDINVDAEKKASYKDIIVTSTDDAPWYKVTLDIITISEKSCREVHDKYQVVLNADNIDNIPNIIKIYMSNSTLDYNIVKIEDTNIVEVYGLDS